jgi:hypothetical protein
MTVRTFGVYPHAIQRILTGRGRVVRECNPDGFALDTYNYGGIIAEALYKTQRGADNYVERKRVEESA